MDRFELNKKIIELTKQRIYELEMCQSLSAQYNFDGSNELEDNYDYDLYLRSKKNAESIEKKLIALIKKSPKFFINFYYLACNTEPFNSDDSYKILKRINNKTAYKIIYLLDDIYKQEIPNLFRM